MQSCGHLRQGAENMEIFEIKLDSIKPYENNPRIIERAIDKVAESIKEFGFKVPIIVDKDNVIVAGHTRLEAAKKLGLETAPCIKADDLTPEQIKAFRLADNKVAEFAIWDAEKLEFELAQIETINMGYFGFEESENEAEGEPEFETERTLEYEPEFGGIVICQDEEEKKKVLKKLTAKGYDCKEVTT